MMKRGETKQSERGLLTVAGCTVMASRHCKFNTTFFRGLRRRRKEEGGGAHSLTSIC